ncbi:hypothetical protein EJ03DRAFT_331320 [Teratosphaeria nubilosa]|uniref:Inclusion body clearance protein IML2 n=1 Tax=Teratosphaeria nubilosa TaxID=161662 RepID=A0A6G1KY13_9PEZI|nr:hypothetical protein EJ03DRAFT_331320 [Teratosphaeria nubilosa]
MRRWLGSKTPIGSSLAGSKSLTSLDEPIALKEAMASAAFIMNDDVERAERELSTGTSPFHKLGLATTLFLRATLGFEKEIMEQASNKLAEAEESAAEHQRRAARDPSTAHQSKIYPVGAEYALCHAESQLMSAVVAVLNESLTESLRGFYKLRKAFYTLQEIYASEKAYLERNGLNGKQSAEKIANGDVQSEASSGVMTPAEDDDDLEFEDAKDDVTLAEKVPTYQGHLESAEAGLNVDEKLKSKTNGSTTTAMPQGKTANSAGAAAQADQDLDFRDITSDPIDIFIHSGVSMCFGLLQLLLSMIPPAFSRILSLFSFRGDREMGLRMLWSSTKFRHNINGAIAGLVVLGFHNGAIAFCDILTRDALPTHRLKALLQQMRELYPDSKLWLLEESRMLAADRNVEKAVQVMNDGKKSPLKQVEALRIFERSLNYMYLHRYEECAASFIETVGVNNWSHALYYYIAGTCHVELYRLHKEQGPKKAEEHAAKAEKYLREVPSHLGKKKFMGRQLPFDTFVARKIAKWEHRTRTRGCKFVDAAGVSPVTEMAYFWSGFKRMNEHQLKVCLERLAWSTSQPMWAKEPGDERALLGLLQGTCLRFLGQVPQAKTLLSEQALSHDLAQLKTNDHPDTWPLPCAHYEMAVCFWEEAGHENGAQAMLQKCSEELAKVERWESFDLEARIGLKVATARETLMKCGIGNP